MVIPKETVTKEEVEEEEKKVKKRRIRRKQTKNLPTKSKGGLYVFWRINRKNGFSVGVLSAFRLLSSGTHLGVILL